jgi:hypothetical protein
LGVPQLALASGEYGWFARQGGFSVKVLDSCAADVKLYTSATAGVLDDSSSTQSLIEGLRINAAAAGSGGPHTRAATATKMLVING